MAIRVAWSAEISQTLATYIGACSSDFTVQLEISSEISKMEPQFP